MVWYTHNVGARLIPMRELESGEECGIVYFNNDPDSSISSLFLLTYPDGSDPSINFETTDTFFGEHLNQSYQMLKSAPTDPKYYPEDLHSLPQCMRILIRLSDEEDSLVSLIPHIARLINVTVDAEQFPFDPNDVEIIPLDLTAPVPMPGTAQPYLPG